MRRLLVFVVGLAACSDAPAAPASGADPRAPARRRVVVGRLISTPPASRHATSHPTASVGGAVAFPPPPERAMRLYATHCAVCHGERGLGDGPAAPHLEPRPWSFEGGLFKWATTANASATDADILHVLRRGVPGTAMPPHADLADDDLRELVGAVRHLALVVTADRIRAADPEMSGADVLKNAQDLLVSGPAAAIPPRPAAPPSAAGGSAPPEGFERRCRECHGVDGTGRGATESVQKDAMGKPIKPRDLTRDVLRGGDADADIAMRLARGIPGTPMPRADLPPALFWDVVDYVRRLRGGIEPDAAVQRRATIDVARVERLPTSASDPAWAAASTSRLPLMPLRAGPDVPSSVDLRVVRRARRVAFRIEWRGRGDAASGAAIRLLADPPAGSPFAVTTPGVVARWSGATDVKSAASPPRYVPLSEIAPEAVTGHGSSERTDHGRVVVLDVDLPDAAAIDVVVGAWDGVAEDGRLLEGVTIRHALCADR